MYYHIPFNALLHSNSFRFWTYHGCPLWARTFFHLYPDSGRNIILTSRVVLYYILYGGNPSSIGSSVLDFSCSAVWWCVLPPHELWTELKSQSKKENLEHYLEILVNWIKDNTQGSVQHISEERCLTKWSRSSRAINLAIVVDTKWPTTGCRL